MLTHAAVPAISPRAALEIRQLPTPTPVANEVRVLVQWTVSTPLDLYQADGHLLVKPPQVLGGGGGAGIVVAIGPDVTRLKVGDKVFGYTWRSQQEKTHQIYSVAPENLLGILPENSSMQKAVTLGNNFVTVFHTLVTDLGFQLPWPNPEGFVPRSQDAPILIWGGSSSVGQYAIQVLKYYDYTCILTTASKRNHTLLTSYGATKCFDYADENITRNILECLASTHSSNTIPLILNCIGPFQGSVLPYLAKSDSKVAILLPVIVTDANESTAPQYSMDVASAVPWASGVEAVGVRTHFYLDNKFLAENL